VARVADANAVPAVAVHWCRARCGARHGGAGEGPCAGGRGGHGGVGRPWARAAGPGPYRVRRLLVMMLMRVLMLVLMLVVVVVGAHVAVRDAHGGVATSDGS